LLKGSSADRVHEHLFTIVEQLNQGRIFISDAAERQTLAALNLQAAQRSLDASVWQAAANYSAVGIELLPENAWIDQYECCRSLYQINAESVYLSGDPEQAESQYQVLFGMVHEPSVKADLCATRLSQCIGRGDWLQAIELGIKGLEYLGVQVPVEAQLPVALADEVTRLERQLKHSVIDNLEDLPEMTDRDQLIILRLLCNLALNLRVLGRMALSDYLAITGCNLILRYGKSDLAALQLLCYALYLRHHGRIETAFAQAVQAKRLAESYPQCREIANVYNILGSMLWYLHAPFAECIELQTRGAQLGLENGEIARAGISRCNIQFSQICHGDTLDKIRQQAMITRDFLHQRRIFHPGAEMFVKLAAALLEPIAECSHQLDDDRFDPVKLEKFKPSFHYAFLLHYRAQLAFWCDDPAYALQCARQTQSLYSRLPPAALVVDHHLFYGLLLVRTLPYTECQDSPDFLLCVELLQRYATFYPPNFLHKHLLLKAENRRKAGAEVGEIAVLYREAIDSAKANGFMQFQALACELFGEFWLQQGFDMLAEPYLREALHLYRNWGCQVKVAHLRQTHETLLSQAEKRALRMFSFSRTTDSQKTQTLDMASVMKSARIISSELHLQKLYASVLQVIMECAGATAAALITQDNDGAATDSFPATGATIAALIRLDDPSAAIPAPARLDACEHVPQRIIRYVLHSRQLVNLGDVMGERAFTDDPYIEVRPPKSVLCMPIEHRDEMIGVLYLENNLSIDAFTAGRLDVINLLLAQAAISFENARLFSEVTSLNQTLERKVENRTRDLALSNDRLSRAVDELSQANEELNSFSYSVSHDLRSPLRGIKGFSEILRNQHAERMDVEARSLIERIIRSSNRMSSLIDGLLELSRLQRRELTVRTVDLSAMVQGIFNEMRDRFPQQTVVTRCAPDCVVAADERMLYSAMENLISNAWKYSGNNKAAQIEFGCFRYADRDLVGADHEPLVSGGISVTRKVVGNLPASLQPEDLIYFIKDNGAGFDMAHAGKLFSSFTRLHSEKDFTGTGIGLATARRVIEKHGTHIWAEAYKGRGATFYFTLPNAGGQAGAEVLSGQASGQA
jgi:signal transduction histidine kinase